MTPKLADSDKSLMRDFLRETHQYSPEEIERLTGVNRESARLYKRGEWQRLTNPQRRKMRAFIAGEPIPGPVTASAKGKANGKKKKGGSGGTDYDRGWRDAVAHMVAVLEEVRAVSSRAGAASPLPLIDAKRAGAVARAVHRALLPPGGGARDVG